MIRRNICQFYKNAAEAISDIKSGSSIACGGFGTSGVPENLLKELSDISVSGLRIISIDCNVDNYGIDYLLARNQISHCVAAYVGENKNFKSQYFNGSLAVELTPMGSLLEKLRAGGAGIPAFYTKTGIRTPYIDGLPKRFNKNGTDVDEYTNVKEIKEFNGKEFVLEESLTADFAFVKA